MQSVLLLLLVVASASAFAPSAGSVQRRTSQVSCNGLPFGLDRLFDKRTAAASHILIKSDDAVDRLNELKADIGNDLDKFASAAAKYSACPSASKGGDLGSFTRGQMVAEFDEACFEGPIGSVQGPIKTNFGAHLIYVKERSEA